MCVCVCVCVCVNLEILLDIQKIRALTLRFGFFEYQPSWVI